MSRNLNTSTGPAPIRRSATAGASAPRHAAPPQRGAHEAAAYMPSKRTLGIVLGVMLALAVAALAWFVLRSAADANTLAADPNAQAAAPVVSSPVPAGSYRLVVNQFATASAGSTTCTLGFDNPAENGYSATLTLALSESGEQLAQAGPVAPGTALDQIDMVRALEPGSYPATLLVGVLSDDTEISQLTTDLTIEVN